MRKAMNFLAGVICGALVGAATGLLLAPYAGNELRERIGAQVQDLVEKGQSAAATKRAELEAQLDAFKEGRPIVLQESSEPEQG